MSLRFFSLPAHRLAQVPQLMPTDDRLEPDVPADGDVVERALFRVEYRDVRADDRVRALLGGHVPPTLAPPGPTYGPSAVFATPPNDLPALLRSADQLDSYAHDASGEKAWVWQCQSCKTRYAIPVGLVRSAVIRCDRCGQPVELRTEKSLGQESLLDPLSAAVNIARRQLAAFFREAMARGWPVLVAEKKV
ncbi:MAG: hypothetical protein ACKVPX_09505 [Myxococcaceae bacterium]